MGKHRKASYELAVNEAGVLAVNSHSSRVQAQAKAAAEADARRRAEEEARKAAAAHAARQAPLAAADAYKAQWGAQVWRMGANPIIHLA